MLIYAHESRERLAEVACECKDPESLMCKDGKLVEIDCHRPIHASFLLTFCWLVPGLNCVVLGILSTESFEPVEEAIEL